MSENLHKPSKLKHGDHLYLIDGSGFIFRAYFQSANQDPKYNKRSDGLPVGAVRLYCNMIWGILKGKKDVPKPSHIAVIFDTSSKSFRNEFFPEYKAHRPDPPADMRPQFGLIRQATRAFNLPSVEMENYEADDLIATYARQAVEAGATVRIITSDKDMMQLIKPGIEIFDPGKEKVIGDAEVLEKFGVTPDKVIDVQSLAGDSVDNVPGVPGIGVKTGAELINTYGDLETLLAKASEIKQQKRRENLINFADQARISKRLVTLDQNVPVRDHIDSFAVEAPRASQVIGFLKALEFTTITKTDCHGAGSRHERNRAHCLSRWNSGLRKARWPQRHAEPPKSLMAEMYSGHREVKTGAGDEDVAAKLRAIPVIHTDYETVTTEAALDKWIAAGFAQGFVCVDTETDSLDAMQANIVGASLATEPGKACYIPLRHQGQGDGLFAAGLRAGQINFNKAMAKLKPLFEAPHILKIGQNLKYDMLALKQLGINVAPIDDTMLLSYVIESGDVGHGMDELSERHLGHKPISFKDVAGSGKSADHL